MADLTTVLSESVKPTAKDVDNGKEILHEFSGGSELWVFENHDPAREFGCDGLEHIKSEPHKPVFVSDNNFFDSSRQDSFQ